MIKNSLKGLGLFSFLGLFLFSQTGFGEEKVPSVLPSPLASPVRLLNRAEVSRLLQEFIRAQRSHHAALIHRQRLEIQELSESQDDRKRQYFIEEPKKKDEFFKNHRRVEERRAYLAQMKTNKVKFFQRLSIEKKQRLNEQKAILNRFLLKQKKNLKDFKKYLSHSKQPPESLWPEAY